MSKKQSNERKSCWIKGEHHEAIRQRSLNERRHQQAILDDVIETGLKVKRMPVLTDTKEVKP